jgi:hypothetical protein
MIFTGLVEKRLQDAPNNGESDMEEIPSNNRKEPGRQVEIVENASLFQNL